MIDVTVSRRLLFEAPRVAAVMFEPRNDPLWIGGLVDVEPPAAAVAVGTRVRRIARFMRRRVDYVLEVTELRPTQFLAMKSVQAPFPMVVEYRLESGGDGATTVSLTVRGGPGGLARLAHPLMAGQVRRNLAADLRRLESVLRSA